VITGHSEKVNVTFQYELLDLTYENGFNPVNDTGDNPTFGQDNNE